MLLRVRLNASRYLAYVFGVIYAASAIVLIPLDLPNGAKFVIAIVIALGLVRSVWSTALLRSARAVIAVELRDGDRIAAQTRDGEWHEARLRGTTYTTPTLTVLHLRHPRRLLPRHVVIAGDSASTEELRRMRVWLRWAYGRGAGETTTSR